MGSPSASCQPPELFAEKEVILVANVFVPTLMREECLSPN